MEKLLLLLIQLIYLVDDTSIIDLFGRIRYKFETANKIKIFLAWDEK